ncbi:MAG: bifunctional diaminohydroxyphosphoribosylaminopyrimidine deaminase/5-amino-6-(5-phosphoribosylamino)uracil reductase RibD, partial [Planctomycetes bacterium]|nr:bifunctional diaminohydroxyphosphoribosylaminopyrimidine deaminase/5-amino-6-(5-phosphoribosylamino)uracil reductase RibD [Planctomycetota bacterium]
MRRALDLARRGKGFVEPNPMVGCVVVRDGKEIGAGYHQRFGGPHAEVHALERFEPGTLNDASVYVTLEPCSHFGKTPPCADLLLKHRPARVVVAMQDPYPEVSGRGMARLRDAGIQVDQGVLEPEARLLNAPYLKLLETKLPWVIAKWAMTLDGAIATQSGDSKWITSEASRAFVHRMRSEVDAILVGSETALLDDPMLTVRIRDNVGPQRSPLRVVMDRRFRLPIASKLAQT